MQYVRKNVQNLSNFKEVALLNGSEILAMIDDYVECQQPIRFDHDIDT